MIAELDLLITMPDGTRKQFGAFTEADARSMRHTPPHHAHDYWTELAETLQRYSSLEEAYLAEEPIWIAGASLCDFDELCEITWPDVEDADIKALVNAAVSEAFQGANGELYSQAAMDAIRSLTPKSLIDLYQEVLAPAISALRSRLEGASGDAQIIAFPSLAPAFPEGA